VSAVNRAEMMDKPACCAHRIEDRQDRRRTPGGQRAITVFAKLEDIGHGPGVVSADRAGPVLPPFVEPTEGSYTLGLTAGFVDVDWRGCHESAFTRQLRKT
jgi:hypothetical protein